MASGAVTRIAVGQALAAPWVDAAARAAIEKAAADAHELAVEIEVSAVADPAGAARVTELLTIAASTSKRVEEARLEITRPLKAKAKEIEDAVRPLAEALEGLITAGKRKVLEWQRREAERVRREREERERQEADARRAAQAAATASQKPVPVPAPAPPIPDAPRGVRTDYGTASVRQSWDFEIVDASKLPPAFVMPNEKAIRAAVNAGSREIPGVRVFQRQDLAVRVR